MASRKIEDCVEELQQKVPKIIADYNAAFPDRTLFIVCTLRSAAEQYVAFRTGHSQIDGIHKIGKHNPIPNKQPKSRAVDFGVLIDKKYMSDAKYYYPLLDLARKYDLVSGIDFKQTGQTLEQRVAASGEFRDWCHLECKTD